MNLTLKAMMTMGASLIDQFLRIAINFILTPFIVLVVGTNGYGVWQMILKTSSLIQPLDGRGGECVKWALARQSDNKDDTVMVDIFSSAVIYSFLIVPFLMIIGYLWFYFSDFFYGENDFNLKWVLIIFTVNIIFLSFVSLLDGVLRGVNLAYKRIGFLSFVTIIGGFSQYYILDLGYGLIGLAIIQLLLSVIQIITLLAILKNNLAWFSFVKPQKDVFFQISSRSIWFSVWSFINIAILTIDVLLVGYYFTPEIVAKYTLTLFASQTVIVIVLTAISSILPGVGNVVGENNHEKAKELRKESSLYTWLLATSICAVIVIINKSFVHLWVGSDAFIGNSLNVVIIILSYIMAFIRYESAMLNMALSVKKKVTIGIYSLLFTIFLSYPFVNYFGLLGFLIALLFGRLLLYYGYLKEIKLFLKYSPEDSFISISRVIGTVLIFAFSIYLSSFIYFTSWLELISFSCTALLTVVMILYVCCFDSIEKRSFILRIKKVI